MFLIVCKQSQKFFHCTPVSIIKPLPLWCNVGWYHCVLTMISVGIIRIWSQMSSGVKPVLLWVVPVNKLALRDGIVRKACHRFLENK